MRFWTFQRVARIKDIKQLHKNDIQGHKKKAQKSLVDNTILMVEKKKNIVENTIFWENKYLMLWRVSWNIDQDWTWNKVAVIKILWNTQTWKASLFPFIIKR